MKLIVGVVLLIGGIVSLLAARPKNGKVRSFVGTVIEVPVVLTILGAIAFGTVLSFIGAAELR